MEIIKLPARYGYTHELTHIKDNLWLFNPDPKSAGYYRLIGNYPNDIKALDPDGGPFLSVGDKIKNYTIKSINSGGIFELIKEEDNEAN